MNEWLNKMWNIQTMEYYSALKRSCICNNMNEPGGYYARWNKPEGKRQILHNSTHMWEGKKANS